MKNSTPNRLYKALSSLAIILSLLNQAEALAAAETPVQVETIPQQQGAQPHIYLSDEQLMLFEADEDQFWAEYFENRQYCPGLVVSISPACTHTGWGVYL